MANQIFQIKIALCDFKPSIWRRILVNSEVSLADLHKIIQTTMGWSNYHLHQFVDKKNNCYTNDIFDLDDALDYSGILLNSFLKNEKDKLKYEYDFGDGWKHDIVLEKVLHFANSDKLPKCIKGKWNCPPEDCGGVWGYEKLLEIIANPKHKEYKGLMKWLGGDFDPEYFDIEEINEMLQEEDYGCFCY